MCGVIGLRSAPRRGERIGMVCGTYQITPMIMHAELQGRALECGRKERGDRDVDVDVEFVFAAPREQTRRERLSLNSV